MAVELTKERKSELLKLIFPDLLKYHARPRTPRELGVVKWSERNCRVYSPQHGDIPFKPWPYQRAFLESKSPRRMITKARQVGFSQIFAIEALFDSFAQANDTILFVSRNEELAVNILAYVKFAYDALPDPIPCVKRNDSELSFKNGSRIKSLPANVNTGRGFAARSVYLDEFAFAAYAKEIKKNIQPSVGRIGSRLTIGSSPNGQGNQFSDSWHSDNTFEKFIVPWWECPDYYTDAERAAGLSKEQSAWYLRERPKYTAREWAQEYECDFMGSGSGVFRTVRDVATAARQENASDGHQYVIGVDWGRSNDSTVFSVVDVTVMEQCYRESLGAVDFHSQLNRLQGVAAKFKPTVILVEYNSIGAPMYESLLRIGLPVQPFTTTQATKLQLISNMEWAFENKAFKILDDGILIHQLNAFESKKSANGLVSYSAPNGQHDDEVMALALSYCAAAIGRSSRYEAQFVDMNMGGEMQ